MSPSPLRKVTKLLEGTGPESDTEPRSALYECPACERVYISEGMEQCPDCRCRVEEVPTEPLRSRSDSR